MMVVTAMLQQNVLMISSIVTVTVQNVFTVHGNVMAGMTVQTVQMKLIVDQQNVMSSHVLMDHVHMTHGYAMATLTVQTVQTKLIALLQHVKIKVYSIVAMANVFLHHMYAMVHLSFVTQAGLLTVLMVQTKV
tara:strand:- start:272 stop:670 length:399 start_codon:yes stop_codon:yes gene_type:complete